MSSDNSVEALSVQGWERVGLLKGSRRALHAECAPVVDLVAGFVSAFAAPGSDTLGLEPSLLLFDASFRLCCFRCFTFRHHSFDSRLGFAQRHTLNLLRTSNLCFLNASGSLSFCLRAHSLSMPSL